MLRYLSEGMTGDDVLAVQQGLNVWGVSPIDEDGVLAMKPMAPSGISNPNSTSAWTVSSDRSRGIPCFHPSS
jgi:hypothetical protein